MSLLLLLLRKKEKNIYTKWIQREQQLGKMFFFKKRNAWQQSCASWQSFGIGNGPQKTTNGTKNKNYKTKNTTQAKIYGSRIFHLAWVLLKGIQNSLNSQNESAYLLKCMDHSWIPPHFEQVFSSCFNLGRILDPKH